MAVHLASRLCLLLTVHATGILQVILTVLAVLPVMDALLSLRSFHKISDGLTFSAEDAKMRPYIAYPSSTSMLIKHLTVVRTGN